MMMRVDGGDVSLILKVSLAFDSIGAIERVRIMFVSSHYNVLLTNKIMQIIPIQISGLIISSFSSTFKLCCMSSE